MKKLWRDIRDVLRGAAVQAAVKVILGVLAALGAADAVSPDPVGPQLVGAVEDKL